MADGTLFAELIVLLLLAVSVGSSFVLDGER